MRPLALPLALAALLGMAAPRPALPEERATTKQAEALVHSAVAYLKKEGLPKALAAFNQPKGPFAFRDLYISAYDLEGKCLAHGTKPERVGKNHLAEKDADGKLFIRERIERARSEGHGWQEYKYLNPVTGKVEQKVSYFERVGDVILMCGAYRP